MEGQEVALVVAVVATPLLLLGLAMVVKGYHLSIRAWRPSKDADVRQEARDGRQA